MGKPNELLRGFIVFVTSVMTNYVTPHIQKYIQTVPIFVNIATKNLEEKQIMKNINEFILESYRINVIFVKKNLDRDMVGKIMRKYIILTILTIFNKTNIV